MALWQISFLLVPELHFEVDGTCSEEKLAALLEGNPPAYVGFSLPEDYAADLDKVLEPGKGWCDAMEYWGNDDSKSDDFTIWRDDDGQLETVEARIDVRKLDTDLLAGLLDLAKRWKCVLVERRYHTVCKMDAEELRVLIAGHPHSRAMREPGMWLPVLSDEVKRGESEER